MGDDGTCNLQRSRIPNVDGSAQPMNGLSLLMQCFDNDLLRLEQLPVSGPSRAHCSPPPPKEIYPMLKIRDPVDSLTTAGSLIANTEEPIPLHTSPTDLGPDPIRPGNISISLEPCTTPVRW